VETFCVLFPYNPDMSRYDRPSHRVYISFFLRDGWQVQFLESDLKTPLPRKLTFSDPEKIRELAKRGKAWGDSESRQMLEHAEGALIPLGATRVRFASGWHRKLAGSGRRSASSREQQLPEILVTNE
jgi:hypothetical protein